MPQPLQKSPKMNGSPLGMYGNVMMGMVPSNQRINNNDRIEYTQQNPLKLSKFEHSSNFKEPKVLNTNVITRFAYSTREGFSVNNANKKNQDNFILAPNMCQTFH